MTGLSSPMEEAHPGGGEDAFVPPLPPADAEDEAPLPTVSGKPIVGYDGIPTQELVLHGTLGAPPLPSESESEESSDEDEVDESLLPPGPIDINRCLLSGPGLSGGSAGSPVKMVITAKDSGGRRIREGGAYILVTAEFSSPSTGGHAPSVGAEVVDREDGTYIATYTVPSKGLYKVFAVFGREGGQSHDDGAAGPWHWIPVLRQTCACCTAVVVAGMASLGRAPVAHAFCLSTSDPNQIRCT